MNHRRNQLTNQCFRLFILTLAVGLFGTTSAQGNNAANNNAANNTAANNTAAAEEPAKPTPGEQVEQQFKTSDDATVDYLLYLPEDYDQQQQLPIVLFLHGRGESYGPLSLVAKWGPPRFAAEGDELPFIMISPQCPGDDQWGSETQQKRLKELLDATLKEFKVDPSRVYLTGLSMGGYGSWEMAAKHPETFAAVAPVCGGGDPEDAEKLKSIPIWVWHGTDDGAVPFSRSKEMVEAIKEAGGELIRFTSLEHVNHNSWSAAYGTPDLMNWMLSHKRGE